RRAGMEDRRKAAARGNPSGARHLGPAHQARRKPQGEPARLELAESTHSLTLGALIRPSVAACYRHFLSISPNQAPSVSERLGILSSLVQPAFCRHLTRFCRVLARFLRHGPRSTSTSWRRNLFTVPSRKMAQLSKEPPEMAAMARASLA